MNAQFLAEDSGFKGLVAKILVRKHWSICTSVLTRIANLIVRVKLNTFWFVTYPLKRNER